MVYVVAVALFVLAEAVSVRALNDPSSDELPT
jgi:hypothetical protein